MLGRRVFRGAIPHGSDQGKRWMRPHETIDGLRREYLPEPYRNYRYEGSRPGTGWD
jgi:hypothetical protein